MRSKNARRHSARRCLVSSNRKPVPAPSGIVSAAPTLKKSSNRLSSLNCWRLSVPRYLSCSHALRAANNFKMGARTRSARMPPCDRLPQAVTMPAAIGTERFVLIGVASLLHAKATEPPPSITALWAHLAIPAPVRPKNGTARTARCQHPSAPLAPLCSQRWHEAPVNTCRVRPTNTQPRPTLFTP